MSDTTFIDQITTVPTAWLNDVNSVAYRLLGASGGPGGAAPATRTEILNNLGVSPELSLISFGADPTGTTSIAAALTALEAAYPSAAVRIAVTTGTYKVAANHTLPSNITLAFEGGVLRPDNGITFTIAGGVEAELGKQIFSNAVSGQGTIAFTSTSRMTVVTGEWWGATGDGITDDSTLLNAAWKAATTIGTTRSATLMLLDKQYKANLVVPPYLTGAASYPVERRLIGNGTSSIIRAYDLTLPALKYDGANNTTSINALLRFADLQVVTLTTTNVPAIQLLPGSTRIYGGMSNVYVYNARYNSGGGDHVYLEGGLGFFFFNMQSEDGHRALNLLNSSNTRVYGWHGRVNHGAFLYQEGGAGSSYFGVRCEDSNFQSNDTAMPFIHMKDTSGNSFVNLTNEGRGSINSVIKLEGTGAQTSVSLLCSHNTFIGCQLAAPQRTDIVTNSIYLLGNCFNNTITGALSSVLLKNADSTDVLLAANGASAVPMANVINLNIAESQSPPYVITVPTGARDNDIVLKQTNSGRSTRAGMQEDLLTTVALAGRGSGMTFTNFGAAGAVVPTLPAALPGSRYKFVKATAQNFRPTPLVTSNNTSYVVTNGSPNLIMEGSSNTYEEFAVGDAIVGSGAVAAAFAGGTVIATKTLKYKNVTVASGSPVCAIADTTGLVAGMHAQRLLGTALPSMTYILSVDSGIQITLSANANSTLTASPVRFVLLTCSNNSTLTLTNGGGGFAVKQKWRAGGAGKYLDLANAGDSVQAVCNVPGIWDIESSVGTITYEP